MDEWEKSVMQRAEEETEQMTKFRVMHGLSIEYKVIEIYPDGIETSWETFHASETSQELNGAQEVVDYLDELVEYIQHIRNTFLDKHILMRLKEMKE